MAYPAVVQMFPYKLNRPSKSICLPNYGAMQVCVVTVWFRKSSGLPPVDWYAGEPNHLLGYYSLLHMEPWLHPVCSDTLDIPGRPMKESVWLSIIPIQNQTQYGLLIEKWSIKLLSALSFKHIFCFSTLPLAQRPTKCLPLYFKHYCVWKSTSKVCC